MLVTLIGILGGAVIGSMMGAGAFGIPGAAIGAIIGGLLGGFTLALFAYASASKAATEPYVVKCPETETDVDLTVPPAEAGRAFLAGEDPTISDCSRWPEKEGCDRACEERIEI